MAKEVFSTWGMLVLSVICNVYGSFVIKLKLNESGAVKIDSLKNIVGYFWALLRSPLTISGLIFFFLSPFLFAIALSRMEIVVAYPVQLGLNFLFLLILAVIILGEQITIYKVIGMIFILIGVYFLSKVS